MNWSRSSKFVTRCLAISVISFAGCGRQSSPEKPASVTPSSATRAAPPPDVVGPFYVGLSSLDVEANERAARIFDDLAKEVPDEPAVWTNLGLARLRLGDLPGAEDALGRAAKLSPDNDHITVLQATIDESQGQFASAIQRLRKIPHPGVAVLYHLADLVGRTGSEADPREQLAIYDRIEQKLPNNLMVAFARARLLAHIQDQPQLQQAFATIESHRQGLSPAAVRQLDSTKTAIASGNFRAAATALTFLQNLVVPTPAYQEAQASLGIGSGSVGEPIRDFLKYGQPKVLVSPADEALAFVDAPAPATPAPAALFLAAALSEKPGATFLSVSGAALHVGDRISLPVTSKGGPLGVSSLCAADLNGDRRLDLAFINGDGLKLWLQEKDGRFTAVQPSDESRSAFAAPGHGVWALDFDADGDLDLLVARDGAPPRLLRNNGDGTFTALDALAAFPEVREVCWGDFDRDGNSDLALIDATGQVRVSWNHRAGAFSAPEVVTPSPAVAVSYGDLAGNGEMSLVVLGQNGVISRFAFDAATRTWTNHELVRWSNPPDLATAAAQRRVSLHVADLDNNGAPDLVASAGGASAVWLNQGAGRFQPLARAPALFVTSIADVDADGLLDLAGLTPKGAAVSRTRGTKGYHWQEIEARALATHADGRINSFGIGGRIELRAGPLLAEAPIISPRTHFGLGDRPQAGMARLVWPNGTAQVEFDLQPDQEVTAVQRLKGSCPWVFAWDGKAFRFVKDFIWRSPLGMRINSQDTAGVDQTTDWIIIPGADLAATNGAYEIRITAELWETHFFDHVALKVVDHPSSVTALIDERFVPTKQPKLEVIAARPPRPFTEIRDQSGRDVSGALAASDGRYVDDFPLGRFQGIAGDHWIEFELPPEAPADQPIVLVGEGWIYPTDSSLNVAISQGNHPAPQGLSLEAFDPQRGWQVVSDGLGFPAGKNKTVVIPFPRAPLQAGHRRFRLRTNLEIYWDRLGWSITQPNAELKISSVETLAADLRYRGFSDLPAPVRRMPDIPEYARLSGPGPRWQDLEGFYTRFGDIQELLRQTDDRYVIMNAGDEIALRFAVPPPPPAGWTRDFVLVGDGWVKDGDFNTANSRTVGPLPSHAIRHYESRPEALEDDPVFRQHQDDWRRFHTRYVNPAAFERGLMHGSPAPTGGAAP